MADRVVIHTDGGADPNPGIGGWAAVLRFGGYKKTLTGNDAYTTNNRMELQAALEALKALKRPCQVSIYTDSEYLRLGMTERLETWVERDWMTKQGEPIPNAELWQELQKAAQPHEIEWHWVQGHSGDPDNELVDRLAREARLAITPSVEIDAQTARLYLRASCKGNPGPGGWGAVLETSEGRRETSGSEASSTNNRMELMAAVGGLKLLRPGDQVLIFTTSDYVFQGATRWLPGWRQRNWRTKEGRPIANDDLWREIDRLSGGYRIQWVSAKGQTGPELDAAWQLAAAAVPS